MAIEKAFRIDAEPSAVWEALWSELSSGDRQAFTIERSSWPSLLSLTVDLGGIRALITYRVTGAEGYSEVSATLEPLSRRYLLYQILTFGHTRTNYEMMLVHGLANLKAAVESGAQPEAK